MTRIGHQENGLDLGIETLIHRHHLEFIFEVGHGAQAAHDHRGADLGGEFHQQRVKGDDFDRGDTRGLLVEADQDRALAIRTHAPVLDERVSFHGGLPAALARRVYQEFRQADDAAPLAVEGLILELLAAVSRSRGESLPNGVASWLGEARDRLHADVAARPSLAELAAGVGVHPVTLARAFRRAFGCTVGEYLRRLRIERAAEQLATGSQPLAEIALAAGFADQSHFSNVFRRRVGMSPSAYRREVRGR